VPQELEPSADKSPRGRTNKRIIQVLWKGIVVHDNPTPLSETKRVGYKFASLEKTRPL